jgi:predicted RNA binding protein YcfA (HicA-like mRNA interferase family)
MQVPWRDFIRILRKLGYVAQKSRGGSTRYFFNPARDPNSVSFNEPHPGDSLRKPILRRFLRKLQLAEDEFMRLLENG